MRILFSLLLATTVWYPGPDDIVENPRSVSANGRFCVVVRQFPNVADFGRMRAGELALPDRPLKAALYEIKGKRRHHISTTKLDRWGNVIVGDGGAFVLQNKLDLTIYDRDGHVVRRLNANDILTEEDIRNLALDFATPTITVGEDVLSILVGKSAVRVSLADGTLLDEKRSRYPVRGSWVTVESDELLSRAIEQPLPVYPVVAQKARVAGAVRISLVVDEEGRVVSTEAIKPLPFGLTEAALDAAKRWTFKPSSTRVAGDLVFHFGRIERE